MAKKNSDVLKKSWKIVVLAVGATAIWFALADAAKVLYTCPMHPNVVSDKPGRCPICGMDLVPIHDNRSQDTTHHASNGAVIVDPVVVQNMGVRVAKVVRTTVSRRVRTIGEIDVAEDQLSVVNLRFSGWVERIYVDETGQSVRRGQALFSIYSPELVAAQKEYLIAYNTSGNDSELARAAAEKMRLWGIPQAVLSRVAKQQRVDRTVVITAPRSGYVLHKNIVAGARVVEGTDLYRIGNLKTIWVTAEVYEFDAPWIRVEQTATMELSYQRGRTFHGKVNYIYPILDKKSRTLKVRLEFENPGIDLKPGMFATVWIEAQHKHDVLVIPTESILRSGQRQLVFVTPRIGRYEPREIVTGLVGDGHNTEVVSGLSAGETVVTSGQFLLDSESQLQEAVQKMVATRLQVKSSAGRKKHRHVSRPPIDAAKPPNKHEHSSGHSATDTGDFPLNDARWTCPMHPAVVKSAPGECPICGMKLIGQKEHHKEVP